MKYQGTAGITSMNITIHLTDVHGPNIHMTQTFGTEFKQVNLLGKGLTVDSFKGLYSK